MADIDQDKLDKVVLQARQAREQRELGYREQALKMYPHICGRCGREFSGKSLRELTVHHRDHNHDNNPADGSNWELLCLFCHDNEHQRQAELAQGISSGSNAQLQSATHNPFAELKTMLESQDKSG